MKLYGYWRSSATYRIRIILALKGLSYDYAPVNLLAGDQTGDAYGARNPQRLVPSLETDDGATLTQSLAIAEYLEERHPDPGLLPDDLTARAHARMIACIIACEAQPFMNLRIQKSLKADHDFSGEDVATWLQRWGGGAMTAAEALVEKTMGAFAVGEAPSLADAFIVPQVYGARRFGIDLTATPRLVAIEAACNRLDAFRAAHPDNQPDATTG